MTGVCAKLHNYCIGMGENAPAPPLPRDVQEGDEEAVFDNNMKESSVCGKRTGGIPSSLRRNLTTAIGAWGQMRPASNSRRNHS